MHRHAPIRLRDTLGAMVLVDHGNGSPQESVRSSLVQQGVWITERAADVGSVYHVPLSIDFTGELNLAALLQSCQDVTRRHPILTASVADEHGVPMLRPGAHPCHPEVDDLSALPPAERDRQLDKR
ncbi:MAG: condensation domain-containing protein, partial [Micromonosporaceae bacterium]